jgi:hypothetical protein
MTVSGESVSLLGGNSTVAYGLYQRGARVVRRASQRVVTFEGESACTFSWCDGHA